MVTFYKGVLCTDLRDSYVPGTVTTSFKEAMQWCERISSNKSKGAARHVKHGRACIISIEHDESTLQQCDEFQKAGVQEHSRVNCWTSLAKTKAQINTPVKYRVLSDDDVWTLFRKS